MKSNDIPDGNRPAIARDTVAMKKSILMGLVYRTAALLIFIAAVAVFFPGSVLSVPAISAAIILYADAIGGIALTGRMARPLSSTLKVLAVTVFLTMLVAAQDQYPALRDLGLLLFLPGGIWSVHFLSKAYSEFTGVVTRSLLIAAVGLVYYSVFSAVTMPVLSRMAWIALIGLASASVFSLLSILKRHSNPGVAYIGQLFTRIESPMVVCMVVAAIMTYLLFIRESLRGLGFFGMTVVEWAALCAVILFLAIKIRALMPRTEPQKFGDGHRAASSLNDHKGPLKNAAAKVDDFIRDGKKDGLIALIASALIGNDVPVETIQAVISIIVEHEDEKEPPAIFKWAMGNINEANRRKRVKAVEAMMAAAFSAVEGRNRPIGASDQ